MVLGGPDRRRGTSWKAFLRTRWEAIAGADLFAVEVLTLHGLTRYLVFFVIELKTRRVELAGIFHKPQGEWIPGRRNLLDTAALRRLLRDANVEPLRLPARTPNLTACAKRFVRKSRAEHVLGSWA